MTLHPVFTVRDVRKEVCEERPFVQRKQISHTWFFSPLFSPDKNTDLQLN